MSEPDYQEEWEQLDEKVMLASLIAEQQRTNALLAELTGESEPTREKATPMYDCQRCNATVKADDRKQHAESQHKTPPGAWQTIFEPAE
jgi:hypothetical protein